MKTTHSAWTVMSVVVLALSGCGGGESAPAGKDSSQDPGATSAPPRPAAAAPVDQIERSIQIRDQLKSTIKEAVKTRSDADAEFLNNKTGK